jgi:hypothetical protein
MKELYVLWALEFAAFLISLVHFNRLKDAGMQFIPVLLTVVVLSEVLPYMVNAQGGAAGLTRFLYYTLRPLRYICIFLLFRNNTLAVQWKSWINGFIGITVVLTILFIFLPKSKKLSEVSYTIEAAMIVACCVHYLYGYYSGKGVATEGKRPLLYLATGTLLFYLGTLPLYARYNYLGRHHRALFSGYGHIAMILAYAMYGLIISGMLRTYYSRKDTVPAG